MRVTVFACVAAVALIADQVTKAWAQAALADGRTVPVIPGLLSFTLVHNPGASLGLGASSTWLISLLAIAACIALLVCAVRTSSARWSAALGLAFAGAVGNLIDRIAYADGFLNGKVVDFLNYGWSVGNVADIALVFAAAAMVLLIACSVPFSDRDPESGSGCVSDRASDRASDRDGGSADTEQDAEQAIEHDSGDERRREVSQEAGA